MTLQEKYDYHCATPSDINYHLPKLKEYAEKCEVIVELGVRTGLSTVALLMGRPKELHSYDLGKWPEINEIEAMAEAEGLNFKFTIANDLEIEIPECDMIWIDTFHDYAQLKKELELHANKAKHWISLHDTFTFGRIAEPSYEAVAGLGTNSGKGLLFAIEEFLEANKNWVTEYHTDENNGMTILKRLS